MQRRLALLVSMSLAGCQCTSLGIENTRFSCRDDADCLSGFVCGDLGDGRECVREGTMRNDAGDERDAGVADSGSPDAGMNGAATKLAFVMAPATVDVATCSAALTLETRTANDDASAVEVDTALTLTWDGGSGTVAFFTASDCTGTPTTSLTVTAGASRTSFFAQNSMAGALEIVASNPSLGNATHVLEVATPPNQLAFTTTLPNPIRGGTCIAVTLEARSNGAPLVVATNTPVGLTSMPTNAIDFYGDSACLNAITTAQLSAGTSLTTFFVKVLTGGMATMSATAPFGAAMQNVNITSMVRRGSCDFGVGQPLSDGGYNGATFAQCNITPPVSSLNSSFLLSQATSTVTNGQNGAGIVRCRFASTTQIQCIRRHDADSAQVHFQVVEVPQGLRSQRLSTTSACGPMFTLAPAVDPSKSFVLKSSSEDALTFDDEEVPVVQLVNSTQVVVSPATCNGLEVQVIEWDGVEVERISQIDAGLAAGEFTRTYTMLPAVGSSRAVISQSATTENANVPVSSTLARAWLPSPTSIEISRGAGDAGAPAQVLHNLYLERISFGSKARVDEYTVVLNPGTSMTTQTIAPVDTTRTIVFASSQSAGGQGSGETDDPFNPNNANGAARFVLMNSTSVRVTRAAASATAAFTFYVVELNP